MDDDENNKAKKKVIKHDFARWFTDAEIDEMGKRLELAESVTIPKSAATRIIKRMRAAK